MRLRNLRHTIEIPINNFDGRQSMPTISDDGKWLVTSATMQNPNPRNPDRVETHLEFWDLATGKSVRKIELETPMIFTALSPDGKWLAASNGQSVLRFFDAASGKEVHNIRMRRAAVSDLAFSPDSKTLYVADHSGTIGRFDPVRGERIGETKTPVPTAGVRYIAFPGRQALAMAYGDAIHFWKSVGQDAVADRRAGTMVEALVFSQQGSCSSPPRVIPRGESKDSGETADLKRSPMIEYGFNDIIFDGPGGFALSYHAVQRRAGHVAR